MNSSHSWPSRSAWFWHQIYHIHSSLWIHLSHESVVVLDFDVKSITFILHLQWIALAIRLTAWSRHPICHIRSPNNSSYSTTCQKTRFWDPIHSFSSPTSVPLSLTQLFQRSSFNPLFSLGITVPSSHLTHPVVTAFLIAIVLAPRRTDLVDMSQKQSYILSQFSLSRVSEAGLHP